MRPLSTLVYVPVLFTLLAACGRPPMRFEGAATPVRASANPVEEDQRLAKRIDQLKVLLLEEYTLPFDPDTRSWVQLRWSPNNYLAPRRAEIIEYLRAITGMYERRQALAPRPEVATAIARGRYMLWAFGG